MLYGYPLDWLENQNAPNCFPIVSAISLDEMTGIPQLQPLGSDVAGGWNPEELGRAACFLSSSPSILFAFYIFLPNYNPWSFSLSFFMSLQLLVVGFIVNDSEGHMKEVLVAILSSHAQQNAPTPSMCVSLRKSKGL